jgi:hypothetical protein
MPLEVSAAFGRLLQSKHLYQSELVDTSFVEKELENVDRQTVAAVRAYVDPLLKDRWMPSQPEMRRAPFIREPNVPNRLLWFETGTAKLFCETCDRIEAFNPLIIEDITAQSGYEARPPQTIQVFASTFLCQSCKAVPEAFLVRRVGMKLTLCGRAPMEHVGAPSYIPKNQQRYFSGAIVAFQAGQVLPALFMLRTTIEQFVREQSGKPVNTPEALAAAFDSYMKSLPEAFRSTFPSLSDWYARLSIALHSADASSELFDTSRFAIEKHFDARRIFELSSNTA